MTTSRLLMAPVRRGVRYSEVVMTVSGTSILRRTVRHIQGPTDSLGIGALAFLVWS
jgi:hypothetical protein